MNCIETLKAIVKIGGDFDEVLVLPTWSGLEKSKKMIADKAETDVMDMMNYSLNARGKRRLNNDVTRHLWILEVIDHSDPDTDELWNDGLFTACGGYSCPGRLTYRLTGDRNLAISVCDDACAGAE